VGGGGRKSGAPLRDDRGWKRQTQGLQVCPSRRLVFSARGDRHCGSPLSFRVGMGARIPARARLSLVRGLSRRVERCSVWLPPPRSSTDQPKGPGAIQNDRRPSKRVHRKPENRREDFRICLPRPRGIRYLCPAARQAPGNRETLAGALLRSEERRDAFDLGMGHIELARGAESSGRKRPNGPLEAREYLGKGNSSISFIGLGGARRGCCPMRRTTSPVSCNERRGACKRRSEF